MTTEIIQDGWYQISSEKATFLIRVGGGYVLDAAPIARAARGQMASVVFEYHKRDGATIVRLEE